MANKTQLIFIFRVFNAVTEDKTGLVDDLTIELLDKDLKIAEKRALEISGRKYARILSIIEKDK